MSLSKLPYEIISLIVQELELDDVFHLSLSPRFSYLIKEDRVCKAILEVLSCPTNSSTFQSRVCPRDTNFCLGLPPRAAHLVGTESELTSLWRSQGHLEPPRPKKQDRLATMHPLSGGCTRGGKLYGSPPPSQQPLLPWRNHGYTSTVLCVTCQTGPCAF